MKLLSKEWNKNFLAGDSKPGKDFGIFILRVAFGLVLIYGHGFGKLVKVFSGQEIQFGDPIGLGTELSFYLVAFAEGVCTILLIIGLFTRYAAMILTFNFCVILLVHAVFNKDGFDNLELIFLYLSAFIAIIFTGPGKFSLDYSLFKKNPAKVKIG